AIHNGVRVVIAVIKSLVVPKFVRPEDAFQVGRKPYDCERTAGHRRTSDNVRNQPTTPVDLIDDLDPSRQRDDGVELGFAVDAPVAIGKYGNIAVAREAYRASNIT